MKRHVGAGTATTGPGVSPSREPGNPREKTGCPAASHELPHPSSRFRWSFVLRWFLHTWPLPGQRRRAPSSASPSLRSRPGRAPSRRRSDGLAAPGAFAPAVRRPRSGTASLCGVGPPARRAPPPRLGSQHLEEHAGDVARISRFRPFLPGPPRPVLHREDLSGDESEHAHQGGGRPVQEVVGDWRRADEPRPSQLSLAHTKARSRASSGGGSPCAPSRPLQWRAWQGSRGPSRARRPAAAHRGAFVTEA